MLNNNNPTTNLFSEKVGESMTNCSEWTQWATQQETMEPRQKNLALLSFSINPRFHLSPLCLLEWIFLNYLSQIFVWTIGLNYLSELFVSTIWGSPGEEHSASPPSLADHCSRLLWACSLHVFPWCRKYKNIKNINIKYINIKYKNIKYISLALSMSSLGATMISTIAILNQHTHTFKVW